MRYRIPTCLGHDIPLQQQAVSHSSTPHIPPLLTHYRRLPQKIQAIFRATLTHALNLTKFVTLYKLLLLLQRKVSRAGKERSLDSFVAGALGGWWVFGERTAVSRGDKVSLRIELRIHYDNAF